MTRRGDYIAQRIVRYLRTRQDLNLQLVAVDATSRTAMSALVSGMDRPLGGCMLLSAVIADSMFASYTQESFERAFPPKVEAFRTLESAVDLAKLEFVVAFSSVSGALGNPGQTSYAAYVALSSLYSCCAVIDPFLGISGPTLPSPGSPRSIRTLSPSSLRSSSTAA